jgi:uncharacterized protein YuzE
MKLLLTSMLFLVSSQVFATSTYECKFDSFSDGKTIVKEDFKLTFLVDEKADKAYILGNNGSNEVANIYRGDGRTFIEITGTGNVMTTTITPELEAVHSRHSVMFGKLIPSQYYGKCGVK